MKPSATRVHDVVSALVELADRELPGVAVWDGPRAGQDVPDTVLLVGVSWDADGSAYSTDASEHDMGGRSRERGRVSCEISTWTGDHVDGVPGLRSSLVYLMGRLDGAFRADPRLSGTCDRIFLGPRARWYVLQREDGAGLGCAFDVTYEAWL